MLTCFLLTILKLVNVIAKCTILNTNGDLVCFFILIFFLIWCTLVVTLFGQLPQQSPLALLVVRVGRWRFGHDWSGISASVEVNISHVTV